jgi:hypothetical protein
MDTAGTVVLADTETHGELGRLVNALSTTDEFKEHGDEVTIIFDGAGVRWPSNSRSPTTDCTSVSRGSETRSPAPSRCATSSSGSASRWRTTRVNTETTEGAGWTFSS